MQTQSIKTGERTGRLINIKMNKLTNVVENQSAELHRLRDQFVSKQKQGERLSDEDTQMLQDMELIHETTVKLKRTATLSEDYQTPVEADELSPTEPYSIKRKAEKADAQADAADSHGAFQGVVSGMLFLFVRPNVRSYDSQVPKRVEGSLQDTPPTPAPERIVPSMLHIPRAEAHILISELLKSPPITTDSS